MVNGSRVAPDGGAVTASSQAAVDAGHGALASGGNAVDAAVTAAVASCVADGCNTGIGGYGGHMVIAPAGRPSVCIDFNAWQPGRFSDTAVAAPVDVNGPQASCVPNVVAGLHLALSHHGLLDWQRACAPAIELAAHGVAMNETTRAAFEDAKGWAFIDDCFRCEERGGTTWFRQPALAETLRKLAEHGPEWFYDGPLADTAITALRSAGREITRGDWAAAREAVAATTARTVRIGDVELALAPAGTSGSVSMAAAMAAGRQLLQPGVPESADRLAEWAERIAGTWAYRLATPDGNAFSDATDLEAWVERALAAAPVVNLKADGGHTCHLNTADADGTLVALTLTHGPQWFGARWALPDTGIIMNSGMTLFSAAPPRRHNGRIYAVTNMAPTVAHAADDTRVAVGCPGARRIPTNVGLMLARHLFGGLDLQSAVSAGRIHAETSRRVGLEPARLPAATGEALGERFERVREERWHHYFGPLTAIGVMPDGSFHLGLDDREMHGYGAVKTSNR